MNSLQHLISNTFNRPLALEAGYARVFFSALSQRLGNVVQLTDTDGVVLREQEMEKVASGFSRGRASNRSYQVVNGIAVIPIDGSLVHKYGHVKPYSGMTGYDGIMYRLTEAVSDPEVKALMLDMNTPGGMVAGCFDLADKIAELRKVKPIWSLGYDMHCSAGQMIASACTRRLITQTGIAGSVGVIMAHTNLEKMLNQQGVEITLVTAGDHKSDGNPYQSLPKEVREKWQSEAESTRQMFAGKAAQYMGIDVKKVLATEAQVYEGQAAVDVGFADEVVNGLDAIQLMAESFNKQSSKFDMGAAMTDKNATKPAAAAKPQVAAAPQPAAETEPTQEELNPAPAPQASAPESDPDPATQERERCMGILGLEESKGREALAHQLANNPKISVEDAKAFLSAAPVSAVSQNNAALQTLSAEHGDPLGQDVSSGDVTDEQQNINALAASYTRID
ncbi:S49 family peptidase [Photobacterium atrarenae]|uniref:S49 family peptidase n=1 Tax=Photobacterium atrarenae TaxID=865757 RepID=A0ABY5GKB2_9GAMM|nr:S49 family peptidase [Photobacterium atrarenae]UTV28992.1 S49 family peptidase [Photobacterium atrarenae]